MFLQSSRDYHLSIAWTFLYYLLCIFGAHFGGELLLVVNAIQAYHIFISIFYLFRREQIRRIIITNTIQLPSVTIIIIKLYSSNSLRAASFPIIFLNRAPLSSFTILSIIFMEQVVGDDDESDSDSDDDIDVWVLEKIDTDVRVK